MTDRLSAISSLEALDRPAKKLGSAARRLTKPKPVKELLSGSRLGHPLHPVLTDVTLGTLTSAVLLDWLGGESSRPASRRLIGIGLLSAVPTVATGYSDWGDAEVGDESARRVGLVHAACNGTATALFAASLAARARGGNGRMLALAGAGALAAGGYLGGHLAFAEGVGVNRTTFEEGGEDWTPVLGDAELTDGEMRCVVADRTPVLVTRVQGGLYALSNRCSHFGGPLNEGGLDGFEVTCPWHDSVFDVRDGALVHGPAAYPQPAWDARVREGQIEVRRR